MRNLLVLGCGRSGTSLMMGLLSKAGYYMGDDLYPPRDSNPKGFFECAEINNINEDILSLILPKRPKIFGFELSKSVPGNGQRWLARVPITESFKTNESINKRIEKAVNTNPFCYKDPRFSYTLPIWQPFLPSDTGYIVIFRHPSSTVKSILKECDSVPYLKGKINIDTKTAFEVWELMYAHILKKHQKKENQLIIHYEQILTGEANKKTERFTHAKLYPEFAERKYFRSMKDNLIQVPEKCLKLYEQLCEAAKFSESGSNSLI